MDISPNNVNNCGPIKASRADVIECVSFFLASEHLQVFTVCILVVWLFSIKKIV